MSLMIKPKVHHLSDGSYEVLIGDWKGTIWDAKPMKANCGNSLYSFIGNLLYNFDKSLLEYKGSKILAVNPKPKKINKYFVVLFSNGTVNGPVVFLKNITGDVSLDW